MPGERAFGTLFFDVYVLSILPSIQGRQPHSAAPIDRGPRHQTAANQPPAMRGSIDRPPLPGLDMGITQTQKPRLRIARSPVSVAPRRRLGLSASARRKREMDTGALCPAVMAWLAPAAGRLCPRGLPSLRFDRFNRVFGVRSGSVWMGARPGVFEASGSRRNMYKHHHHAPAFLAHPHLHPHID